MPEHTRPMNVVAPPVVGLGLWKIDPSAVAALVEEAVRVDYRHLDSACDYGNEAEAGAGIRRVLHGGLCRREDLWVTSKLWNTFHAPEHVRPACERTLRDLLASARIRPAVLQVELHPYLTQEKLLRFCREEGIAVTAFSPLGAPSYVPLGMAKASEGVLDDPVTVGIARDVRRTPAQVVLRWAVQRGTGVIPKTSRPERLRENLAIGDFALTGAQMLALSELDRGRRFNDPGVFCEAAFNTFCPIYE